MIRTRTIREAAEHFKSVDPQTALTEYAIRTLLRTGKVPCAKIGKKYLVTIEAIEAYLAGTAEPAPVRESGIGKEWHIQ